MKTKLFALFVVMMFALSAIPILAQEDLRTDIDVTDLADEETDEVVDTEPVVDEPDEPREISPVERLRLQRLQRRTETAQLRPEYERRTIAEYDLRTAAERRRASIENRVQDIRAHQKARLMKAIEICRERDLEGCEEKFQKRMELLDKLTDSDLAHLKRTETRRLHIAGKLDELRDREHFKKFNKAKDFKARDIAKDKIAKARDRFKQAHDKAGKAKARHDELKKKIDERRAKLAECKDDDSEECVNLRTETRADAKEMLLKITERAEAALEKVLNKVAENEDLSDEEAERITNAVQENLDKLADIKARVNELGEDATREDYHALARELKALVKDSVKKAKRHGGHVISARIGGVIVKTKHMEAKLESMLTRLAEHGIDTSSVEGLVDEFSATLDKAQVSYEKAVEAYKANQLDKAKTAMRAAHQSLKDAHKQLKEIHKQLRELAKDADLGDGDVEEVEAAADEELEDDESDDNAEDEQ